MLLGRATVGPSCVLAYPTTSAEDSGEVGADGELAASDGAGLFEQYRLVSSPGVSGERCLFRR